MTIREKRYFEWLTSLVTDKRSKVSYNKLLEHLYNRDFVWITPLDSNRAEDGLDIRRKYFDYVDVPESPCSMLEMMIALAVRCEEHLMTNDEYGDRTGEWFWNMVLSLKLNNMTDYNYDPDYVDERLFIFETKAYGRDGSGGLFTTSNPNIDMRGLDIWYQLQWYLNDIL